jgi:Zn-finger nucleic acid-binding protein
MNCPACKQRLIETTHKGIKVDRCGVCQGIWLDHDELDTLEDTAFDQDELKGTVVFGSEAGNRHCPKCGDPLHKFKYRLHDLQLEFCEQKHGFWLDGGEEQRVIEIMKDEIKDLEKKFNAENNWAKTLKGFKSPSLIDKIVYLFKS